LHFLRKDLNHGLLISEDEINKDLFKFKVKAFARRKSCICTASCFPQENKVIVRLEMRELLINNEVNVYQMQENLGLIKIEKDSHSDISNSFDYSD
jgi:ribosomal protein S9